MNLSLTDQQIDPLQDFAPVDSGVQAANFQDRRHQDSPPTAPLAFLGRDGQIIARWFTSVKICIIYI